MLFLNISPIFLRCGVVLEKTESVLKEIDIYKDNFKYINPNINIYYKNKIILFFKISYFKIQDFKNSQDYIFLKDKIIKDYKLERKEENILELYKNNNEIISDTRIKNDDIEKCYYCGELSGQKEFIIYEIFKKKCMKFGTIIELTIKGINFLNNNIEKTFFNLDKKSVSSVISVGDGMEKVIKKNYINIKNKLYPYLLTVGQEGVSVYRVDSINSYKRIGGNSFGPTTLWSLLTLSCGYEDPDLVGFDLCKGNNKSIDLSVGDIYGGNYENISLSSDLIGSSFGKFKNIESLDLVDKKDISKSMAILYGATYSHITALVSHKEKLDKLIISGNPFNSLEVLQIIQTSIERYSNNFIKIFFNDYLDYFEIIGMFVGSIN